MGTRNRREIGLGHRRGRTVRTRALSHAVSRDGGHRPRVRRRYGTRRRTRRLGGGYGRDEGTESPPQTTTTVTLHSCSPVCCAPLNAISCAASK
jgi:hypothetical protein